MKFTPSAIRHTAWATVLAVLFVVLLPAAVNAAGRFGVTAALPGLQEICSVNGVKALPQTPGAPNAPDAAVHRPCLFCTSSVPVFADAHAPRIVAVIDGVPVTVGPHPSQGQPPDAAATRPVSPRAPPGA